MDVEIAVRVLYMLGEAMSVRHLWLLKLNKCISHAMIYYGSPERHGLFNDTVISKFVWRTTLYSNYDGIEILVRTQFLVNKIESLVVIYTFSISLT